MKARLIKMRVGSRILLYPIHQNGVGKPLEFVSQVEASAWLGKSRFYVHERIARHNCIAHKANGLNYYINYGQDKLTQDRDIQKFITEYSFIVHKKKYQQIGTSFKISKEERKRRNERFSKGLERLRKIEDKYGYQDNVARWTWLVSKDELRQMQKAFGVLS